MRLDLDTAIRFADTCADELTVVVGAGAVGLYLAVQLAERGMPVLIIESGDDGIDYFDRQSYRSVGLPHNGIERGRVKSIGGTTRLWGGQLAEFIPVDFDWREDAPSWLVSCAEMRALYAEVYRDFGFLPDETDDQKLLSRIKSPPLLDGETEVFLTRWLNQPNFSRIFSAQLGSESIRYVPCVTVVGMRFRGASCSALEVLARDGRRTEITCGRVILAAGTIETVRLMANVAHHSAVCPWRDNDNLGRYFQDHIAVRVGRFEGESRGVIRRFSNILYRGKRYQPKIRVRSPSTDLNACGFFSFDSSMTEHLTILKQFLRALLGQKSFGQGSFSARRMLNVFAHLVPLLWAYVRNSRMYVPGDARITLNVQSEIYGLSKRSLSLDVTSRDEAGLHPVVLDWQLDGREVEAVLDFVQRLSRDFAQSGLGRLVPEPALVASAESARSWLLSNLSDTYHQAGGAIMGSGPDTSVVNEHTRVHGADNVYVCGACTFPRSSYANTTFTALAMAKRLAAYLEGVR